MCKKISGEKEGNSTVAAAVSIPAHPQSKEVEGYLVKIAGKGALILLHPLGSVQEAETAAKGGIDILLKSEDLARDVAKAAGDGAPIHHTRHGGEKPHYLPHYHPRKRSGEQGEGHVFYLDDIGGVVYKALYPEKLQGW